MTSVGGFDRPGDPAPALPLSPPNLELLEIHDSGLAAKPDALGPSPGLAGPHALADPLPLLLCYPSEHGEQEIPDAPKLIVDPPLPEGLAQGVFWAQYRVQNVRIVPVFGAGALQASPRIGHLHITVDDLPWWADASDNNTVDIAGLPPGQHKVKIELVDANHNVFPGQVVTLTFTVPARAK